jgi:hypothetical protein
MDKAMQMRRALVQEQKISKNLRTELEVAWARQSFLEEAVLKHGRHLEGCKSYGKALSSKVALCRCGAKDVERTISRWMRRG